MMGRQSRGRVLYEMLENRNLLDSTIGILSTNVPLEVLVERPWLPFAYYLLITVPVSPSSPEPHKSVSVIRA